MSLERLEQQLQTLPQWPELRTGLTSSSKDYGLWEELTRLIIEIETGEDDLDWENLLEPGERRFEEPARQAYLRAVLIPVMRQLLNEQEYIERYCMVEWFNQQPPTVCFSMAQTIMLESYEYDDDYQIMEEEGYRLLNIAEITERFLAIPELPDLRNLEIYNERSDEHLVHLLEHAQMPNLKSLVISCPIAQDVLSPLLEALAFDQLQSLSLSLGELTDDDWRGPQSTTTQPALTGLYLTVFHAREAPLRRLLSQACFEHLTYLHVMVSHPPEEPSAGQIHHIPNILNVLGQPLMCSPQTIQAEYHTGLRAPQPLAPMAKSNALNKVMNLTTSGWMATTQAIEAIVEHAHALTSLNLFNAGLTDAHIEPLLKATMLEVLGLDNNLIGPEGAHRLATSELMKTLDYCSINHNMISVQSKEHLINMYGTSYKNDESQAFGELRSLLQDGPSSANWATLCERLNTWQDTPYLREVVLPYLLDHLEQWPDELCTLPLQWSVQLTNGYNVPCLPIVRALTLGHYDYTTNREILGKELAQVIDQFKHLKHLYVDNADADALLRILSSPVAQQLVTFEMTQELYGKSDPNSELYGKSDPNSELYGTSEPNSEPYNTIEPNSEPYDNNNPNSEFNHVEADHSAEPGYYLKPVIKYLTALPELETLHLNGQYLQEEHLKMLSISGILGRIKTLKLEHNTIMGAQNLSVEQTAVTSLSLCGSYLEDSDLQTFFHGNLFDNLTQLDLSMVYCSNMHDLIDALADNARLNNLRQLWMAGIGQEDDREIARLFRPNRFPHLTDLDLSDQSLQASVIKALVDSGIFAQLKALRVNWANLPAGAFLDIVQSAGQLEHLAWAGNQVDAQGLKQLVDAPWASTIKEINFSECQSITSVDMLEPVLMATTFTQLESLTLYNDQFDVDDLRHLDREAMHPAAQHLVDEYLATMPWSDDDYLDDYE